MFSVFAFLDTTPTTVYYNNIKGCVRYSNWNGKRTNIAKYYGKYVRVIQVINYAKYFRINFIRNGKAYYADSRDKTLFYSIHRLNHFPINFKITKYDWRIYIKNRKENVKPQT